MATITFSPADVKRLLNLPSTDAVEALIQQRVLEVHGYTRRGRPLFTADAVHAASAHVLAFDLPRDGGRRARPALDDAAGPDNAA